MSRRPVDYMIGMDQSSWLPEIYSKSESSEGDLWMWRNDFGKCVAGRHPWVAATPQKNLNTMFSVLNTLHSSELQYWPEEISTSYHAVESSEVKELNENVESANVLWEPEGCRTQV